MSGTNEPDRQEEPQRQAEPAPSNALPPTPFALNYQPPPRPELLAPLPRLLADTGPKPLSAFFQGSWISMIVYGVVLSFLPEGACTACAFVIVGAIVAAAGVFVLDLALDATRRLAGKPLSERSEYAFRLTGILHSSCAVVCWVLLDQYEFKPFATMVETAGLFVPLTIVPVFAPLCLLKRIDA